MPARFRRIIHQQAQVSSFETFYSNPESLMIVLLLRWSKTKKLKSLTPDNRHFLPLSDHNQTLYS